MLVLLIFVFKRIIQNSPRMLVRVISIHSASGLTRPRKEILLPTASCVSLKVKGNSTGFGFFPGCSAIRAVGNMNHTSISEQHSDFSLAKKMRSSPSSGSRSRPKDQMPTALRLNSQK